jgi:hypothetical protein
VANENYVDLNIFSVSSSATVHTILAFFFSTQFILYFYYYLVVGALAQYRGNSSRMIGFKLKIDWPQADSLAKYDT